jgi:outer membrane protein assembly factor BamD
MQRRLLATLVTCLGLTAVVPGCVGSTVPAADPTQYTENARLAYENALVPFFDRDWEVATPLLQEVSKQYAYSRYARLAELRLADIQWEQGAFAESVTAYREFVRAYPNDPEVSYARFRIAKGLYEQRSDSILMPPLEERDLAVLTDSRQAILAFLQDYPDYQRTPELEYLLEVVTGTLARHELYVSRFYLDRGELAPAEARARWVLSHFPEADVAPESLVLLGEVLLMERKYGEARRTFQLVLDVHPSSPYTVPARRFLDEMPPGTEELGPTPAPIPSPAVEASERG